MAIQVSQLVRENKILCLGSRWLGYRLFSNRYKVAVTDLHQLESTTGFNRYPSLFQAVQLAAAPASILCYGCSTGDECFSLREYFPDAHIVGVDINPENIAIARRRNKDPQIEFRLSDEDAIRDGEQFDAIFALSVLCKWPETKFVQDISGLFPFEQFERAVSTLDDALSPNGLLIVYNSNFRMMDSACYENYRPIIDPTVERDWVHKFSAENEKLEYLYGTYIFQKI